MIGQREGSREKREVERGGVRQYCRGVFADLCFMPPRESSIQLLQAGWYCIEDIKKKLFVNESRRDSHRHDNSGRPEGREQIGERGRGGMSVSVADFFAGLWFV